MKKKLNGKRLRLRCSIIFLILSTALLFNGCDRRKKSQTNFFKDNLLHYAIYVNPDSDCQGCIYPALDRVNEINRGKSLHDLNIIALKTESTGNFISNLKEKYGSINVFMIDKPLSIPHPALLIVKKNRIYMFIHLVNNPFDLKKLLEMAGDIKTNYIF
jgi:hypothetical protein